METIRTYKPRLSETLPVAALLAVTGGFLDAYTYLYRGGVFANGQTGNLVLLSIKAAEQNWEDVVYYVLPICAFLFGVLIADCIRIFVKDNKVLKWRNVILLMEMGVMITAVCIPQGKFNPIVNIMVSFVCALQTQSFRSLNGKPYISVMCTGNMRSAMGELSQYIQTKQKRHFVHFYEYILVILSFVIGAFAGSRFIKVLGGNSLWFPIAILLIVFIILFFTR